jgi:AraC-like DNA-binding protein
MRTTKTTSSGKPGAGRGLPDSQSMANLIPNIARALLGMVEDRGHSPERLCRGLGFTFQDLLDSDLLLSHQQTRTLILRAQDLLGDAAIGLATGARQTPVSWGLPGLAMLTCETFGEAILYGISHQNDAGAMLDHMFDKRGREMHLEVMPRIFDLPIEPYLIEESFASVVALSRHLVGDEFKPVRLDLNFQKPAKTEPYAQFFRCPVRFEAGYNRITFESRWLEARLPGYDRITCGLLRQQLNAMLKRPLGRHELVVSVSGLIRSGIEDPPSQAELAREVNMSERTLRRRLGLQKSGFRTLRDNALFERSKDLLKNSNLTLTEVAQAVGYSDPRAFRRAFKRWSGQLPTTFRNDN